MRTRITILETLESIRLDVDTNREYDQSVIVPEHPVDSQFDVSDNAQKQLKAFTIETLRVDESTQFLNSAEESPQLNRLRKTVEFFDRAATKQLRVIVSHLGAFEPVQLTGYPHSVDKVKNMKFSLSFRVVREAEASTVEIPPEKTPEPSLADDQNVGQQSKDPVQAMSLGPNAQKQSRLSEGGFSPVPSEAEQTKTDEEVAESQGWSITNPIPQL